MAINVDRTVRKMWELIQDYLYKYRLQKDINNMIVLIQSAALTDYEKSIWYTFLEISKGAQVRTKLKYQNIF